MNINIYPNPWDLRYFQVIAETKNLSRAAERLAVGQPALSLSLKRIEDLLGAKLFLRRNRGLVLTSSGQKLLQETNQLLSHWEKIVTETKKSNTEITGNFSLGCHASVAVYALQFILKKIYKTHPKIEMKLKHGLSRTIAEQVISGSIDFGIVVNPIKHPDLVIQRLAKDEVCFWSAPDSLTDVLLYQPELIQSQALLKKIDPKVQFKRFITSESLEVLCKLASTGTGTAILPTRVAQSYKVKLSKVKDMPSYFDEISLVYRVDHPKSEGYKTLKKMLQNLVL